MADNVIPFDKYHHLKKRLRGYGTPDFANAYAEARGYLHTVEGRFLKYGQLTHLASKLSPLATRIFRQMMEELQPHEPRRQS